MGSLNFKLYYITDNYISIEDNLKVIHSFLNNKNLDKVAIQVRYPSLNDSEYFCFAKEVKKIVKNKVKLFINDRIDMLELLNFDGIHLKDFSLPIAEVVKYLNKKFIIGKSAHRTESIFHIQNSGIDFVTYSPIYETESKKKYLKPLGVDSLSNHIDKITIPVIPLGGITLENIDDIVKHFKYIGGIKLFSQSTDINETINTVLNKLGEL